MQFLAVACDRICVIVQMSIKLVYGCLLNHCHFSAAPFELVLGKSIQDVAFGDLSDSDDELPELEMVIDDDEPPPRMVSPRKKKIVHEDPGAVCSLWPCGPLSLT